MKRFNTIVLTLLLTLVVAAPAMAVEPMEAGGMGGFMFGAIPIEVGDLNAALTANGYETFPESVTGFGVSGQAFVKRVVLGGEAMGFKTATLAGTTHNVSLAGGYGLFRVGYVLRETETTRIYPTIGLGAAGAFLKFTPRTGPDFDDVLADPGQASELSWIAPLVDVALGADYVSTMGVDPSGKGSGGLAAGIRLGYMKTFASPGWRLSNMDVPGGPGFGFTGPYVRLVLGGGGRGPVELPAQSN